MNGLRLLILLIAAAVSVPVLAFEFRSVAVPAAVLYDTPSLKGQKLHFVRQYTPLEVVVRIEGWVKVRDAEGGLSWIEAKALTDKRHLVVTASTAEIRKTPSPEAALVFEAEKWVALELLEPVQSGWARVRHRDGAEGYVKVTQVWGF